VLGVALLAASGCERSLWDPTTKIGSAEGHIVGREGVAAGATTYPMEGSGIDLSFGGPGVKTPEDSIKGGTGEFVGTVSAPPADVDTSPGDVTLNFDGTDIREVVKVILGDLLGVNYVLDPGVQGTASLQTGRPLRREHLVPTLETLLRMNNAALVSQGGSYQVVPLSNAVQGKVSPQLGETERALPNGYSVQVVPLRYIGAEEMSKILQPLAPEGSVVRVDTLRNLLLIAGTGPEMGNLLDTVRVFDVDWMAGLSVGFFTLEYASAGDVVTQLETLLADETGNPFKGLFRFIPVESANSLLVISPRESYLRQVKDWIERLDLADASGEGAQRVFVYRVKHGDAQTLADIITQLFSGDQSGGTTRRVGGIAPGMRPASIQSRTENRPGEEGQTRTTQTQQAVAQNIELSSPVSIVADTVNNSLLIKASPRDYKMLLEALKQLDLVPLQVLVEATIVEISLTGNLQYGVQWQFFGKKDSYVSDLSLVNSATGNIAKSFPGFNWAVIVSPDQIRATLSALASDGLVNVLSSPSVMVLDNQTAKIQVGKAVPILTSQSQGTATTDRIVNSVEYRDTGVMLTVKPRVTPGGLVQMEIEQEVSTAEPVPSGASLQSPEIATRNITSTVAVRSNQAVVLGGLIEDSRTDGKQGIPGLYSIPVFGALFGETSKRASRRELVVVLVPRVIASDQDVEMVSNDFRRKVKGLTGRF
jgi:general secretion pathway protein D